MPLFTYEKTPSKGENITRIIARGLMGLVQGREQKRQAGLEERGMGLQEAVGQARIGSLQQPKKTAKRMIRGKNTWWMVDPYTGEKTDTGIPIAPTSIFQSLFGGEVPGELGGTLTKPVPAPARKPVSSPTRKPAKIISKKPGFLGRKKSEFPAEFQYKSSADKEAHQKIIRAWSKIPKEMQMTITALRATGMNWEEIAAAKDLKPYLGK